MVRLILLVKVISTILVCFYSVLSHSGEMSYLSEDIQLDCYTGSDVVPGDAPTVRTVDQGSGTRLTVELEAGQDLWVAATTLVEYQPSPIRHKKDNGYSKEFVETYLMCGPNKNVFRDDTGVPTNNPGDHSMVQSRTGVNHWEIDGQGSRVATTHYAKALYTAEEPGKHTCWVIYACGPKSGDPVLFDSRNSFLLSYAPGAYPGTNWVNWAPEGGVLVDSTETHTPGGSKIWNAGTSSEDDSELVVYWSPRLTNCEDGDHQCGEIFDGYDADTYFDWRLVVYQYNETQVCNKAFGSWNNGNVCKHHDHHCDFKSYRRVVPVVVGDGSESSCGERSASRKFKVYTQIRKSADFLSDIMVQNKANGYSSFFIYSR